MKNTQFKITLTGKRAVVAATTFAATAVMAAIVIARLSK